MGTLEEIARKLQSNNKKVQLIYAFNGTGKTRLSKEFQSLLNKSSYVKDDDDDELNNRKIIYYNAFTEDLFYWDNDLKDDIDKKLKIHTNTFTDWIFIEQGQDGNVIDNFQNFINKKGLTPNFDPSFKEITFSYEKGNEEKIKNIKISKGEERCFIWSVFYSLLEEVIGVLNKDINDRETNQFNELEYIFIDDPVTSLDENHLAQLAVDLANLVKISNSNLKFIFTTHNPSFYNLLYNELNNKSCYLLDSQEDGIFKLNDTDGDSNRSFSYHLDLIKKLEYAINNDKIEKEHFILLRNLYEKTAAFLGYKKWSELLPENKTAYYNRIMQFSCHSTLADVLIAEPSQSEKQIVKYLFKHLMDNYNFWREKKSA